MTIFSEIYGTYFRIVSKILETEKISEKEIYRIIREKGFRDSIIFLPKKIIPQNDRSDWGILKKTDTKGEYIRIIKNNPVNIFTELYKRWLKAKLYDPKTRLFIDENEIKTLEKRLADTVPLYREQHFRYTDMFSDGDNFTDPLYIENFRKILAAVKSGEVMKISFTAGSGREINSLFLPLKLEYSQKNDKFRIYCYQIRNGRISGDGIINIGRIKSAENTGGFFNGKISMKEYFRSRRCKTPVTLKVTTERNGIERFLMEFSSYEKQTERENDSKYCTVKLWYDRQDETELLIRLLSFGPVIEIISPPEFRKLAEERIKKQYKLIHNSELIKN